MEIYEMKTKMNEITKSIRELMNSYEKVEMPAEKKEELARMEADYDRWNDKVIFEEKQLARERANGEIVDRAKETKPATNLFAKALSGNPDKVREFQNSYTLGTDASAGYLTAPENFVAEVIRGLNDFTHMRQMSKVIGPIGKAQSLGMPFRKTNASDQTWTAEVTALGEESTLDYGKRVFKPNKLGKLVKLSKILVMNSDIAESEVQKELVYKLGIAQENAYLNGNGTAQPLGIFTASNDGISTDRDVATGNTATAVTFDGLINAKYAVKQQYHANASWIAHRDFAKQVLKIKDGEGQYIWQPSTVAGQPDRLLGNPIALSEYAPNTFTTGLYTAVFGDFGNGYYICDAVDMGIQVLNELYAVNGEIGYLVDYYGDGMPVLEEAFARVKLG